jgi:hypothetical protein
MSPRDRLVIARAAASQDGTGARWRALSRPPRAGGGTDHPTQRRQHPEGLGDDIGQARPPPLTRAQSLSTATVG